MVIAIDGPAGSGKSSTAKLVAQRLGIQHLDTGAMYRAITLKCLREKIDSADTDKLLSCVQNTSLVFTGTPPEMTIWMDKEDVSIDIRSDEVTKNVSDYCKPMVIREALVRQQQEIGRIGDVVCEGRDIGTVVFPDAKLKFFMVASVVARAQRRQKDFEKIGVQKNIEELIQDIESRDFKDSNRENSPLIKADDADEIDTTDMTLDEQVTSIVEKAQTVINNKQR